MSVRSIPRVLAAVALALIVGRSQGLSHASAKPATAAEGQGPLVQPPPQPLGPPVKPVLRPEDKPPEDVLPIYEGHKEYRHKHCTHWLRWSNELAGAAQERVDAIAKDCKVKPPSHQYGENLWSGTADKFPTRKVVDSWYAEGKRYNYKRPGYSKGTARFTQLVWHGSQRYGCATATCKRTTYWVCLYDPPGNVDGQFEENVKNPASCKE